MQKKSTFRTIGIAVGYEWINLVIWATELSSKILADANDNDSIKTKLILTKN